MKIVIPLPPSKNAAFEPRAIVTKAKLIPAVFAWKRGTKGAFKRVMASIQTVTRRTDAYTEYLEALDAALLGQRIEVLEGDLRMSVTAFFPDNRRDMPNIVDVLLDSLEGRAYFNDRQIVKFGEWHREIDKHDPRCVVTLETLNHDLFSDITDDRDPADMPLQEEF